VLHYGNVPRVDTTNWTFMVSGLVDRPFAIT
jgi:DMSO/TMAO reductase YedYZ molybdopterin-dependent catalytic subunit